MVWLLPVPVGARGPEREITPAQIRRAQKLYDAQDLTVQEIADTIGCSRQTVYRYIKVPG